jgi:hypothetical protein
MECIGVGSITTTTQIILDNDRCTLLFVLVIPVTYINTHTYIHTYIHKHTSSWVTLEPWSSCLLLTVWTGPSHLADWSVFPYIHIDVLRRTQCRTPVGSLENAVLCCALFTKPYHSNGGAVLLRVCIAMGMLLHSNEHLQISTVADRLSMLATCGRIPWKAPTCSLCVVCPLLFGSFEFSVLFERVVIFCVIYVFCIASYCSGTASVV